MTRIFLFCCSDNWFRWFEPFFIECFSLLFLTSAFDWFYYDDNDDDVLLFDSIIHPKKMFFLLLVMPYASAKRVVSVCSFFTSLEFYFKSPKCQFTGCVFLDSFQFFLFLFSNSNSARKGKKINDDDKENRKKKIH